VAPLRRTDPTCPVQLLIGRATTNRASGIHHEAYDCDNHNEAAEYAAKLEDVPLPVSCAYRKSNAGHIGDVARRELGGRKYAVCTENSIRVDDVTESPKLAA
jgi:hypothetical protein